jgi:hypothetical protein
MPLTKDFRETVMAELGDPEYRRMFLREALNALLRGDLETAKPALRIYINGTVGFISAGQALGRSSKSLMRMLSQEGNPHAKNLLELVSYLQKIDGAVAEVHLSDAAA